MKHSVTISMHLLAATTSIVWFIELFLDAEDFAHDER